MTREDNLVIAKAMGMDTATRDNRGKRRLGRIGTRGQQYMRNREEMSSGSRERPGEREKGLGIGSLQGRV